MTLSKTMLSAGLVTAVAVGSFAAVGAVSAQSNGNNRDALIEKIANDTGSDVATVEASFDAHREAMRAEHEAAKTAHLDSLVADGTLTQDQRVKFEEIKAEKESLKDQDLTREEIRELKASTKDELKTWAEEQGIDLETIRPEKGEGHGRRGHGRHHFQGGNSDDTSEES